ncbi:MAG: hypothetical protein HFJ36_06750 [Clostridia bacterium]|nr:hypothetical protein [Clostridia bacterium]
MNKRFYAETKIHGPYYNQVGNIVWEINIKDGKIMSVQKNIDGCDGVYQFDNYYDYYRGEELFEDQVKTCINFFQNFNPNAYNQIIKLLNEEEVTIYF